MIRRVIQTAIAAAVLIQPQRAWPGGQIGPNSSHSPHVGAPSQKANATRVKADDTDAHLEEQGLIFHDQIVTNYLEHVAHNLSAAAGVQPAQIKVALGPVYNAFGIPGGTIYLTADLLQNVESEDELASVLAHEMAHISARHLEKRQNKAFALNLAGYAVPYVIPFGNYISWGYSSGANGVLNTLNKKAEREADYLGIQYLWKSGYDPRSFVMFLQKASKIDASDSGGKKGADKHAPDRMKRIANARKEISELAAQTAASPADPKAFAEFKSRLPITDSETETAKVDFYTEKNQGSVVHFATPQIERPAVIDKFDADEKPPILRRQQEEALEPGETH